MKILYVSSNPDEKSSLGLIKEFTELERRALSVSPEPIKFTFRPNLPFENLATELTAEAPDILHIAAHGQGSQLELSNAKQEKVQVNATTLLAFLSQRHPPSLIYINACNSNEIASEVVKQVPMAVGSVDDIQNGPARNAAIGFYDRLIDGESVGRAFTVARLIMEGASKGASSLCLNVNPQHDAGRRILYRPPHLIAKVTNPQIKRGAYSIVFGVGGCPSAARQIVFFSDDSDFIVGDDSLERDLCLVWRGAPVRRIVWVDDSDAWESKDDFRLYAAITFEDGRHFVLSSMISDALERLSSPPVNVIERMRGKNKMDGEP